jgi:hypothetical protein
MMALKDKGVIEISESDLDAIIAAADVPISDQNARQWLRLALANIDSLPRAANQRPTSRDYNDLMASVENAAVSLHKALRRLRRNGYVHSDFWNNPIFGPVTANETERSSVLRTLKNIEIAAFSAQVKGKPRKQQSRGILNVLRLARGFFVRFSPHNPTTTIGGPFDTVAHYFYEDAFGKPPKDAALVRHIKAVLRESRY